MPVISTKKAINKIVKIKLLIPTNANEINPPNNHALVPLKTQTLLII